MSDMTKLYHWTNLILNPILLILVIVTQSEPVFAIAMGWAFISAVLNESIRKWVLGALASLTGASLALACIGSLVGIMVFVVIASFALLFGFFLVLPLLWVLSLKAIITEERGLI